MLSPQEVACQFIPAFFERLACNPAELAEMYSQNSSLTFVDFEYGTTEVSNGDVPHAVEQWSQILHGCELCVESFTAVPLYSGVSVYVTMVADSKTTRQYFQFVNILEAYDTSVYGMEGYFIRHQIVIRPGAAEKEQPVPEVAPKAEPAVEISPETVGEPVAPVPRQPTGEAEREQQQQDANAVAQEAAAAQAAKEETPATEPAAPAAVRRLEPPAPAKPKTWASLASAPPRGEQRQPVRVIVPENGVNNADAAEVNAPAKHSHTAQQHAPSSAAPAAAGGANRAAGKVPRAPAVPIGDRLMFNIDHAVSDEEIKEALGPLAAHIVSLRNNSANGHVFLDFSDKEKVMDTLKANPPTVGARKTRVSIYRQRTRQ